MATVAMAVNRSDSQFGVCTNQETPATKSSGGNKSMYDWDRMDPIPCQNESDVKNPKATKSAIGRFLIVEYAANPIIAARIANHAINSGYLIHKAATTTRLTT